MKPLIIALAFLALMSPVFAQGYFNASNNYIVPGTTTKAFVLDYWGNPLSKSIGRVEIRDAATGDSLSPGSKDGVPLTLDGLFFISGLQVPNNPWGPADLIVLAWDSTTGTSWDQATTRSAWLDGQVSISWLSLSTTLPWPTFRDYTNFKGLQLEVIPEPSAYALATVCLGILFVSIRCRRRQGRS